ncbi:putative disease resistance protein At3g14460 [Eucalyptus grandis]|uniref:putative disease resistance protein At3g14460 n=1 Tax=Eucalyptus grandis TaxID=71139 RepID=UPI00192E9AC8|nr:putative disease resistance protein At3g14460 [Eucalyptus grandis]XP_039156458.1 putative disease resistance protein At3g14460 [Eucalyptus grandis]XP_039156459.1 putative disease resistance protein At3g14460 [Eucalyptus grandis]
MANALVSGAFLSAFLQVLFDRMASREVVDFFRSRKLDKGRLLQKLKAVLLSANAVLDDAEEKQMTNDHVREWLDDLKDAVYDADDLFDEIATEDLKREAGVEPQALVCKVWSFVADARRSKLRDKLERVLERLESVVKQREVLGLREGFRERTARALQTTSLVEESGVFGREKDREAVIKLVLSDRGEKNTSVMAIVGMGGVGKTTLSQVVFNDGAVKGSFELRAWVSVSDQFDICKLTATALEEFSSPSKKETENLNQLQLQLKNFLTGKKFLLVLDDVWNEDSNLWDAFLVPFTYGARGSKIVVTTRNENVASVARAVSTYPLQKLQDDECWDLFAKHAFDQHNFEARTRLEDIGQRIVKRCDGLPLALKTIGSLLRCESGIRKWEIIAESDIWDLAPGKNEILPALLLSYHYLPPLLKRCFAYCSVFPKDCIYKKDQLILLWMAEGLIKQPNAGRTLEEVGDQCFCDLVSRSLLNRVSDVESSFPMHDLEESDVALTFSMHDLVNDLARYVAGRSFFSLDGGNARQVSSSTRHLSFVRTEYDVASRFRVLAGAMNLRTFLPLNVGHVRLYEYNLLTDEVLHVLLPTLSRLRVLSLSHYQKISTLPSSIGCLKHLRYLNLSNNASLIRLPDSITALCNLQTLILAYCPCLVELPRNMGSLTYLRHLDIRWTSLERMPWGMNRLKNLQILTNFVVAENGGTRVRELGGLENLMGTLSIQGLQNVDSYRDAEIVNLQGKRYLKKLVLEWGCDDNITQQNSLNVLNKLQPHWNLRELIIISYGGRSFSTWLGHGSFSNMSVVRLESCKHCVSLPPLGQLPSLEKLIIEGFDGVTSVGTEFNGSNCIPFQSLKYLEFADMRSWKEWASFAIETGSLAFAHLQELRIRKCPELSGGFPNHLPSLTALSIEKCPQLTSSLPFAPLLHKINLDDCGKVSGVEPLLNGIELRDMEIMNLSTLPLRFLPPNMTRLNLRGSCEIELPIHICHESLQYLNLSQSCDSLISCPLEIFPSLKNIQLTGIKKLEHLSNSDGSSLLLHSMDISFCPEFRSFPRGGLAAPCLTSLGLNNCRHLKYLPENMQALFPSLQALTISSCPQLESFLMRGLPSKLVALSLSNCDKLITGRKDWGLQSLCSLQTFTIGQEKNIESFPEIGLLPTSLTSLNISGFENLTFLNSKGLHSLSSLENLSISRCPKLHSFPKEGQILPASLTTLSIYGVGLKSLDNLGLHHLTCLKEFRINSCGSLRSMPAEGLSSSLSNLFIYRCPLLAKRCQRKKGKDWPLVSHIRCIVIDRVLVT